MTSATTNLLQSKFFTPVFNTAIFDGPMRMYFSQAQEPDALKLYFRLQELVAKIQGRSNFEPTEPHLFVMLYPNDETFCQSFESQPATEKTAVEKLGNDVVLGVRGPIVDGDIESLLDQLEDELSHFVAGNA